MVLFGDCESLGRVATLTEWTSTVTEASRRRPSLLRVTTNHGPHPHRDTRVTGFSGGGPTGRAVVGRDPLTLGGSLDTPDPVTGGRGPGP